MEVLKSQLLDGSSRNAPIHQWEEALRDDTNNGFEGDRVRERVMKLPVTNVTGSKNVQNDKKEQGKDTC